jgi:hypothetical protein
MCDLASHLLFRFFSRYLDVGLFLAIVERFSLHGKLLLLIYELTEVGGSLGLDMVIVRLGIRLVKGKGHSFYRICLFFNALLTVITSIVSFLLSEKAPRRFFVGASPSFVHVIPFNLIDSIKCHKVVFANWNLRNVGGTVAHLFTSHVLERILDLN